MSGTDWGAWLRVALQLGLLPRDFWRLSLREWRWLTQAHQTQQAQPMRRIEFEALARRFPDHDHGRF